MVGALIMMKYSARIMRFMNFTFLWFGKFLFGLFTGLGYLIVILAGVRTTNDEKELFMSKYDNHAGGIKVDNKHYSHADAEAAFVKGKFHDKYDTL